MKKILGFILALFLCTSTTSCLSVAAAVDPIYDEQVTVSVSIPEYTFYYLWYNGVYVRRDCLPYRSRYVYYYQGPRAYYPRTWKPRSYTRPHYSVHRNISAPRNYSAPRHVTHPGPSRPHLNNSRPMQPSRSLSPHHPTPSPSRNTFGQHR